MDEMEAVLGPAFVRIRRSVLVRATAILYCEPQGKGSWIVVLHDQTRLTSSRYYRAQLGVLLGE
jgi:DNA-binding LytR/AlgR family response regulator